MTSLIYYYRCYSLLSQSRSIAYAIFVNARSALSPDITMYSSSRSSIILCLSEMTVSFILYYHCGLYWHAEKAPPLFYLFLTSFLLRSLNVSADHTVDHLPVFGSEIARNKNCCGCFSWNRKSKLHCSSNGRGFIFGLILQESAVLPCCSLRSSTPFSFQDMRGNLYACLKSCPNIKSYTLL